MPRYVAFLRGVMPTNASMADLRRCFDTAGFSQVRTVLGSGNVVFDASSRSTAAITRAAEAAMHQELGHSFSTIVRPTSALTALIEQDPFARFRIPPAAKRIVTFLQAPHTGKLSLPFEHEGVRIYSMIGLEVFTTYLPNPKGPVFMTLIEKTFGKNVTTRTWDTVRKCAVA